jgi:hypothetical protein
MDPARFDRLTRALGVAHSRRGVLGALAGVAALVRPSVVRAQGGMNPACPGCWADQTCMAGGTACCTGTACYGAAGGEDCCGDWNCCGIGCCPPWEVCVTPGIASVYRVCAATCPPLAFNVGINAARRTRPARRIGADGRACPRHFAAVRGAASKGMSASTVHASSRVRTGLPVVGPAPAAPRSRSLGRMTAAP